MAKPTLTPRQQEAQKMFQKNSTKYFFLFYIALWCVTFAVLWLSDFIGLAAITEFCHQPGVLAGFVGGGGTVAAIFLAQQQAMRALLRAGLLDEERELVTRTATTFEGENLKFHYPSSLIGSAALVLGLVSFTALAGWFGFFFASDFLGKTLGALGFIFFLALTLLTTATLHLPNAGLDERGVFAYRYNFIPNLARWEEIETAHIHRLSHFNGTGEFLAVTLKNAQGQTLLILNANTFAGSPPGWKERFVAELKRRLVNEKNYG